MRMRRGLLGWMLSEFLDVLFSQTRLECSRNVIFQIVSGYWILE